MYSFIFWPFQNYFASIDKQRGAPDLSLAELGMFYGGRGEQGILTTSAILFIRTRITKPRSPRSNECLSSDFIKLVL